MVAIHRVHQDLLVFLGWDLECPSHSRKALWLVFQQPEAILFNIQIIKIM